MVISESEKVKNTYNDPLPVYLDVYLTALSKLGASTAKCDQDVIKEGRKYADGIFMYTNPDPVTNNGYIQSGKGRMPITHNKT